MISIDRLMDDVNAIARIGVLDDGAVCRRAFSPEDAQARRYLMERMEAAGLQVRVDAAGNIFGRHAAGGDSPDQAAVLVGSHIDTIERAGRYDGVLGVLGALECVRALDESKQAVGRPVEIVAFTDEEERFLGFLGSYAFTGRIGYEDIENVADHDGTLLTGAMGGIGLDPARVRDAARDPAGTACFVELHIEQGPVLDQEGVSIGVVEGVKGNYRWGVTIEGQTDHAGAPHQGRRDAFMLMHRVVRAMQEYRERRGGDDGTLTVGRVVVEPNIETAQPGRVHFSVDFRSPDREFLIGADAELRRTLSDIAEETGRRVTRDPILVEDPVRFDETVLTAIRAAADDLGVGRRDMWSGAGHDAQIVGQHLPAGMIFVPSVGGRSHCPEEYTRPEDIERGVNVLYGTILRLAGTRGDPG